MRGGDVGYRLEVGLGEVVRGAKIPITLADGSSVEVTVPPGANTWIGTKQIGGGRYYGDSDARSAEIRITTLVIR